MTWRKLFLNRSPRCLESKYWSKYQHRVNLNRLLGHEINLEYIEKRNEKLNKKEAQVEINVLKIRNSTEKDEKKVIELSFEKGFYDNKVSSSINLKFDVSSFENDSLDENTFLKLVLNTHSTLVMGRIGRYYSNMMTYVKPSNYKLIDRTIRYVQNLLKQNSCNEGSQEVEKDEVDFSYKEICHEVFRQREINGLNEPIVLKTYESLIKKSIK